MVFINRSTFSNVAGVNIDNVFTSTYKTYLVVIETIYSNTDVTADGLLQLRYGGTTLSSADYYGALGWIGQSATDITINGTNGGTSFKYVEALGDSGFPTCGQFYISRVGNSSQRASFNGANNDYNWRQTFFGGNTNASQTYDGMRFTASTGNITGTISTYGLATS